MSKSQNKPIPSFLKNDYPYKAIGDTITDINTLEPNKVYEIKCPSCEMSIRLQGQKLISTYEKLKVSGCLNCKNENLIIRKIDIDIPLENAHKLDKTSKKFLSIITPVYNTSEYLSICIDSCLHQGMSFDDYEIIFIDDGSLDNSAAILDEYVSKYPNLTAVHKVNGGVSVARNIALDLVQGDYIWFIDSDDFIEKNVLPDIHKLIQEKNPEKLVVNMYHMKSDYFTKEEEELYKAKKLVPGKNLICSAIYHLECINKNKTRFHPELTSNGDLVFSYELRKSLGDYKNVVTFDDPIVYFYRKNGSSITYTVSSKKLNSSISLSSIMHNPALDDQDGFAWYTMVRYIYFSYHGILTLPKEERKAWLKLMREKDVYPKLISKEGCIYYKDHYQTMKIKGIPMILFKWIPTPIGYAYATMRSMISKIVQLIRK